MVKDTRIIETQKRYFNNHFGFFYNDFFNNNKNYYYLIFENINLNVSDQLNILNKLKPLCVFCKVKKKILRKLFYKWNKSVLFLYNPIILKIHVNNINAFMFLMKGVFDMYINFFKKEKQYFDFSFLLYEMSFFYSFNNFFLNYFKINHYITFLKVIYNLILLLLNSVFFLIFKFFLLLNVLILKQNANI